MSSLAKYILFSAMPVYHHVSYIFPSWNLREIPKAGQIVHSLSVQEITTFTAPLLTFNFQSRAGKKGLWVSTWELFVTQTSNITFEELPADLKSMLGAQQKKFLKEEMWTEIRE